MPGIGSQPEGVFCYVLEAIYLQSEAYQESRFSEFINYKSLQYRFLRILWVLSILIFTLSLIRNLTLYDVVMNGLVSFINEQESLEVWYSLLKA